VGTTWGGTREKSILRKDSCGASVVAKGVGTNRGGKGSTVEQKSRCCKKYSYRLFYCGRNGCPQAEERYRMFSGGSRSANKNRSVGSPPFSKGTCTAVDFKSQPREEEIPEAFDQDSEVKGRHAPRQIASVRRASQVKNLVAEQGCPQSRGVGSEGGETPAPNRKKKEPTAAGTEVGFLDAESRSSKRGKSFLVQGNKTRKRGGQTKSMRAGTNGSSSYEKGEKANKS